VFKVPSGGFTVWVELPAPLRSLPLLTLARKAGVEFTPAVFCMPDRRDVLPGGGSALRLAFSRTPADKIEEGVKTLCGVIADCIAHPEKLEEGASSFDDLYR
jgi:DNA-binding transcriptional MocR family regulator